MTWFETGHCRSRAHCVACRGDREFRESIHAKGLTDAVDFECVFGMKSPPFRMAFQKLNPDGTRCSPCAPVVVAGKPL